MNLSCSPVFSYLVCVLFCFFNWGGRSDWVDSWFKEPDLARWLFSGDINTAMITIPKKKKKRKFNFGFESFKINFIIHYLSDRLGKLPLSPKQKAMFSKWVRPEELTNNPTMIYTVSSFSIKQVNIYFL